MLDNCIYNTLDHILPNTGKSNHDILRLEYLSSCNIMENEKNLLNTLQLLPACLYKSLLKSVIYNCYLKFINVLDISRACNNDSLEEIDIPFPETLGILVLNWPYEELILRNQIPSLEPPVDIFGYNGQLVSQTHVIGQVEVMVGVFNIFCKKLIKFITQSVLKCTQSTNSQGMACNLRRLDVSGLVNGEHCKYDLLSDETLEVISNSTIDTFGHTIEIFADAGWVDIISWTKKFQLLKNTIEQSLKPDTGISVCFKTITAVCRFLSDYLPNELYNLLARGRCEYITLAGSKIDQSYVENLCVYLPGLVGLKLQALRSITSLDFLGSFQYLEQLFITYYAHNDLSNALCNMSKGLSYLYIEGCALKRQDFECLAKSNHTTTLLQLDIHNNKFTNDSEAVGLTILCQNLKHVKVLSVDYCSLETMSSNAASKLVNAFRNCDKLEFLSMKHNLFSLEITTIIIDGLTQKESLIYLSLDLPNMPRNGRLND